MSLARLQERIGKGTHTPFRSDTFLGVLANVLAYALMPVMIVGAGVFFTARWLIRLPQRPRPPSAG